jgi:hypothetical protein
VTSSIALSALGILETLKEIKLENPGFNLQLNQVQGYIEDIQIENAGLQTDILALSAGTELSGDVLKLAGDVSDHHALLNKKLEKYRKSEVLRHPHVTRALETCISLGLSNTIGLSELKEKEIAVRNLMDFALECLQDKFH